MPSEVQVLSNVASFDPNDSLKGNSDDCYPQVTDDETGAERERKDLACYYSSGKWW